jgi:cation:H+ antiporter
LFIGDGTNTIPITMNDYIALTLGIVCAGIGGEFFVRGAVGLARWARVSPGIIGATIAAFATSSPELAVAVNSALVGRPQISFGDALGSNVVNVALILAVALLISGIQSPRDTIKRDFPVALLIPVVIGVLFLDGVVSRIDGLLMLGMFITWFIAVIIEARKQRNATEKILGERRSWLAIIFSTAGLVLLLAAGRLIVVGAKGVAISLGIGEFVTGAIIVAVGTSVPELATVIIAKIRRHDEVGLGTILGSNIFNGLLIISVAAIICPISVDWHEVVIALVVGFLSVALTFPTRRGFIGRRRGVVLLLLYAVYLATILQRQTLTF